MAPIKTEISICLTGNEINKAYSNIKTDCCTLDLVLFCDTFEFGAGSDIFYKKKKHNRWSKIESNIASQEREICHMEMKMVCVVNEAWSSPSICDKRDDFNFHITNFSFLSSNIPFTPVYGVFIYQLIRYARACFSYECFILRAMLLSRQLLKKGYLVERLKLSFRKFYCRYGDLIQQYEVSLSRMLNDILTFDQLQWFPIRLSTNFMTLISGLTFTELRVASIQHLQRVWLVRRERLPFRTPGSVLLLGTCVCSNCWDQFYRSRRIFSRLSTFPLLPGTWSHLWFAGVRECPPWCSIVGATVTVHQFFCILHLNIPRYFFDFSFDRQE